MPRKHSHTVIHGIGFQSVQFVQSSIDRHVADKMKRLLIFHSISLDRFSATNIRSRRISFHLTQSIRSSMLVMCLKITECKKTNDLRWPSPLTQANFADSPTAFPFAYKTIPEIIFPRPGKCKGTIPRASFRTFAAWTPSISDPIRYLHRSSRGYWAMHAWRMHSLRSETKSS